MNAVSRSEPSVAGPPWRAGAAYHHVPGFLSPERSAELLARIRSHPELVRDVESPAGLGPRYRVIDGETIALHFPEILELAHGRLREDVSRITGRPVKLMHSLRRAVHVQVYARSDHGFRWHFDGHTFAAMLTLENDSGGCTELLSPALSRWLRVPLYLLYPWPGVFSLLPRDTVEAAAGDLVVLHGGTALHRGTRGSRSGERWMLVFNYDDAERQPNHLRDWWAKRINY